MTFRRGRGRRGFGARGYIVTPPSTNPGTGNPGPGTGNPGPGTGNPPPGDTQAPTYVSGSIDGAIATLVFSEAVLVTSVSGLTFTINGTPAAVASIVGGSGTTIIALQVATAAVNGQTVTFAYNAAAAGSDLRDAAGNEVATVASLPVTNNTAPVNTVPVVSNVVINDTVPTAGDVLAVTFDVTGAPAPSISYSWRRQDGTQVGTSATYTVTDADATAGLALRVTVTASNVAGSGSATSALTSPVVGSGVLRNFYIAPTGNDSTGNGSIGSPWATVQKFIDQAIPGDKLWLRGGTYAPSTRPFINGRSGQPGNKIYMEAYAGETAILSGANLTSGYATGMAIRFNNANYWHIKRLEIANAPDFGVHVDGASSNNIFEWLNIHDIANGSTQECKGFVLFGSGSNNLILNCDSYNNRDISNGNADGFQISTTGSGTVLDGCRAYLNSDDGFDFYNIQNNTTQGRITIRNSWAFRNGYLPDGSPSSGDGGGFKLGGKRAATASTTVGGGHTAHNCLAFSNRLYGFVDNEADRPLTVYNCTAHNNGSVNFEMSWASSVYGVTHTVKNCLAVPGTGTLANAPGANVSSNSWQMGVTVNSGDFRSLTPTGVEGPRQADGSLPNVEYLKLAVGSDLIDKGVNVGLPYSGTAPDLGAYELGTTQPVPTPWTPAQISTEIWLDATDASTFTLSGSNVTEWRDKSGNGNHATGVVGNLPTRTNASTINAGRAAVRTTGGGQRMTVANAVSNNGGWPSAVYPISATSMRAGIGDGIVDSAASTFSITTQTVFQIECAASPATGFQFRDTGASKSSASTGQTNQQPTQFFAVVRAATLGGNSNGRITDGLNLFNRTAGDRGFDGDIGEIVGTTDLTTATRQLIEGYLAWKWDGGVAGVLVGKLPSGHPYKTAAPTAGSVAAGTIVYHGDSTVEGGIPPGSGGGVIADPVHEVLDNNLPAAWATINRGVGGATAADCINGTNGVSPGLAAYLAGAGAAHKYHIFSYSLNDQDQYNVATFKAHIENIVSIVRAAGKEVILETSNPTSYQSVIAPYCQAVRDVCAAQSVPLIDQNQYILDWMAANGRTIASLTYDSVHPRQELANLKGEYAATRFKAIYGVS